MGRQELTSYLRPELLIVDARLQSLSFLSLLHLAQLELLSQKQNLTRM